VVPTVEKRITKPQKCPAQQPKGEVEERLFLGIPNAERSAGVEGGGKDTEWMNYIGLQKLKGRGHAGRNIACTERRDSYVKK